MDTGVEDRDGSRPRLVTCVLGSLGPHLLSQGKVSDGVGGLVEFVSPREGMGDTQESISNHKRR